MLVNNGSGQTTKVSRPAASQPFASVNGTVFDTSDAFIVGASVSLGSGRREMWKTKTGAKGEFQFDGVAPGRFLLPFSDPRF